MEEKLGGTLHIKGEIHYQGGRDELNRKLRLRDDEIDRLRARIAELEWVEQELSLVRRGL